MAYCVDNAWRRMFRNWQKDALCGGHWTSKLSFLVCSSRAWSHWPSGRVWFTEGGRYFWCHLVTAFSQCWTLVSWRRFPPGPNSPRLYWSSGHLAKYIYFCSYCGIGPLREVRCMRKRGIWCSVDNLILSSWCVADVCTAFKNSLVSLSTSHNNNKK